MVKLFLSGSLAWEAYYCVLPSLKPAKFQVRGDGTVTVLDFGLAKVLDTAPDGDPSQSPT